jgi:hypothetical protein
VAPRLQVDGEGDRVLKRVAREHQLLVLCRRLLQHRWQRGKVHELDLEVGEHVSRIFILAGLDEVLEAVEELLRARDVGHGGRLRDAAALRTWSLAWLCGRDNCMQPVRDAEYVARGTSTMWNVCQ